MYHTNFGAPSTCTKQPRALVRVDASDSRGEECDKVAYELWHCWLSGLQRCAWEAVYIACGVQVTMGPMLMAGDQDLKSQEFHQEMLAKLALHLASQPFALPASLGCPPRMQLTKQEPELPRTPESPSEVAGFLCGLARAEVKSQTPGKGAAGGKGGRDGKQLLGRQDQEFHQQMLRMLALHLAAQPDAQPDEQPLEPERPRRQDAKGSPETQIGADVRGRLAARQRPCEAGRRPTASPVGAMARRASQERSHPRAAPEQEFQQEMLRKLALHLAAQPDALRESPRARSRSREQRGVDAIPRTPESPSELAELARELVRAAPHAATECTRELARAGAEACRLLAVDSWQSGAQRPKYPSLPVHPMHGRQTQQEFHQQMLQKLALHLAAQPEPLQEPAQPAAKPQPAAGQQHRRPEAPPEGLQIYQDSAEDSKAATERLMQQLEPAQGSGRGPRAAQIMAWIASDVRTLSLTQNGSRLVQQAVLVAQPYERDLLADGLLEDPGQLLCSPHANHVLAKLISVMPAPRLGRLWEALRGEATTLARHQFGSRILERLIEHCSEDQIGFLLDELTADLEALSRHQFGNFVVQRTLEHCTATRRHTCVEQLLPHVLKHATHKTASNVVVCLQAHSDLDGQAAIADAFLAGKGEVSLENIAATRYGSFVVHNLVDRFHPRIDAVKARVKAAHQQLQESGYSRQKIVNFLGEAFFRD